MKHASLIRQCLQFKENNCRFQDESCWFIHDNLNKDNNDDTEINEKESPQ